MLLACDNALYPALFPAHAYVDSSHQPHTSPIPYRRHRPPCPKSCILMWATKRVFSSLSPLAAVKCLHGKAVQGQLVNCVASCSTSQRRWGTNPPLSMAYCVQLQASLLGQYIVIMHRPLKAWIVSANSFIIVWVLDRVMDVLCPRVIEFKISILRPRLTASTSTFALLTVEGGQICNNEMERFDWKICVTVLLRKRLT